MNIVKLQDQLKNFSQDQLVREMQAPSGNAPQFLVLGEIMRRKRMQDDFTAQQAKDDGGTVAQEAVAAAGVPQGGIADMARALAPSTDMTQNTGVQAMYAGGPVKKMKRGGKAETDPAVIAMANRAGMSVSEYLDALGEEEAARIEAGAAQRAARNRMMAMEPVGDSITMPTQSDLDRRFQEEQFAFGASRPMVAPAAIDMPVVPSVPGRVIGAPAAGLASIAPALPAAPAADMAPTASMEVPAPVRTPAPVFEELGREVGGASILDMANTAAALAPPEAARETLQPVAPARVTRTAPRAAGIGSAAVVPGSVDGGILSDIVDPALSWLGEFGRALGGETVEERDARRAAEAAAEAAPGRADRDQQGAAAVPTPAEVAEAEKAAAEKAAAEEAAKTTPVTTTPSGGDGGAGGIAGVGGMSSYEQELMDTLARREKAAEQDKWLALAQVGLNMMASRQPTLLGAIGEAGLKGVEAVRSARDQYDKDRLELLGALEKSRMARAAAASRGSGGGSGGIKPLTASGIMTQQKYMLDLAESRLASLTGGQDPATYAAMLTEAAQGGDTMAASQLMALDNAKRDYDSAYNNYMSAANQLGALTMTETGGGSDVPDLSDQ